MTGIQKLRKGNFIRRAIFLVAISPSFFFTATVNAGVKFEHSDTLWLTAGTGVRMQVDSRKSDFDNSNEFSFDSIRFYFEAQVHKYLKFYVNTDKQNHQRTFMMDAIARFEFNPSINVWIGRTLVPSDRIDKNGPFYSLNWNQYRQPLFPSGYGASAGTLGRSEGGVFWGTTGRVHYALGIFDGLKGQSNQDNHLLYSARISYSFLDIESNPVYYSSSSYFGEQGDLLTLAFAFQQQSGGSGNSIEQGDFFGYTFDVLSETVLNDGGVFTVEAEYKKFHSDFTLATSPAAGLADCSCLFDGHSIFATVAYLFPKVIGWGKFQPYFRYVENNPGDAKTSDSIELGTNYVISSNNAKLNFNYISGDNNASGYAGRDVDLFTFGVQLQY